MRKKKKKGIGTGIDWIIAIGMFLVYLGLVFILFKPGVTPEYESETLLEILQVGVEQNLSWTITQRPLFIENVNYLIPPPDPNDPDIPQSSDQANPQFFLYSSEYECGTCGGNVQNPTVTTDGNTFKNLVIDELGVQDNNPNRERKRRERRLFVYYVPVATDPSTIPGEEESGYTTESGDTIETTDTVEEAMNQENPDENTANSADQASDSAADEATESGPPEQRRGTGNQGTGGAVTDVGNFLTGNAAAGESCQNDGDCDSGNCDQNICQALEPRTEEDTAQTENDIEAAAGRDSIPIKFGITSSDELIIDSYTNFAVLQANSQRRKYLLVYSNEVINTKGGTLTRGRKPGGGRYPADGPQTSKACVINDQDFEPTQPLQVNHECRLRYTLGVPEILEGLSIRKLDKFLFLCRQTRRDQQQTVREAYDCVKEELGYPDNKDFKIDIQIKNPDTGEQIDRIIFPDIKIPEESRVDVRQFNTFILHKDGTRIPAVVSLASW